MIGLLGVKAKGFVALILSSLLIACSSTKETLVSQANIKPNTKQTINLTVSAAASLTDALPPIKKLYEQQNPEVSITYNFASSGSLQRQIQQGAPADIFISASASKMDALQEEGLLIQGSRKDLLQNKVVLIVPKSNTSISDFKDLTGAEIQKISIGEPNSVPAGKYAKEVLTNTGIFQQVESKTVFAKNVRQVLTYVETGNVDAGIVYATDAKSSDKVKIAAIASADSHSPVVYPVAVIKDSKNATAAKEFVEFLSSKPAGEVFVKHGFTPVKNNSPSNKSQNHNSSNNLYHFQQEPFALALVPRLSLGTSAWNNLYYFQQEPFALVLVPRLSLGTSAWRLRLPVIATDAIYKCCNSQKNQSSIR